MASWLVRAMLGVSLVLAAPAVEAGQPSRGCGAPPPPQPPASFRVAGRERQAIVVVPQGYRPDRPVALVVAFHGRTNDNRRVRRYLGLEDPALPPAIFVYPAGLRGADGRFTWFEQGDRLSEMRDLALFDSILDGLARLYCLDRAAIFVVGHSLGATFANSVACARGQVVRGLGSVAGGIVPGPCSGPVAALLLHNPRDRLVPLSEGERARDVLLEGEVALPAPVPQTLAAFACSRHARSADPVLWCLHRQDIVNGRSYPHQWPRGAAAAIMGFFAGLRR